MKKTLNEIADVNKVNIHTANYRRNISSLSHEEYFDYMKKIDKAPIKYEQCLTIRQIAERFNNLYVAFINDYNSLPEKINIGVELDAEYYHEYDCNGEKCRTARIFVYKNNQIKGNNASAYLIISEEKGIVTNVLRHYKNLSIDDKKYFYKTLDIKPEILKSYLDLFEKHQEFIKIFNSAHQIPLSDQSWVMMGLNADRDLNITDGLKELNIHGYLSDSNDFIFDLHFKLGEDFGLDYTKSKFLIHDNKKEFPQEEVESFLDSLYVNKYYLIVKENYDRLYQHYDMVNENDIYRLYMLKERIYKECGIELSIDTIIYIVRNLCNWPLDEKSNVVDGKNIYFCEVLNEYLKNYTDDELFEQYKAMVKEYKNIFEDTKEKDVLIRRRNISSLNNYNE